MRPYSDTPYPSCHCEADAEAISAYSLARMGAVRLPRLPEADNGMVGETGG
jgi:hypothetical protein